MPTPNKRETLNIRIKPEERGLIDRAAKLRGKNRTDFILGRGAYLSAGGFNLLQRTLIVDQTVSLVGQLHPGMNAEALQRLRDGLLASLMPFEADTAASVMPNITAGRVSNRLGFMGPNYTIDAACA